MAPAHKPATADRLRSRSAGSSGFSLLEVLVALALLLVAVLGLVQVFAYTGRATQQGRRLTVATILAQQKLAQLRGLAWRYDAAGVRTSDVEADTAVTPERPSGGTGLQPSPPGTLDRNADGYCDFLDANGGGLGGGSDPPAGTAFVRRWSIQPLAADPLDTLVLRVRLLPRGAAERGGRDAADILLTTLRTRVAE